MKTEKNQKRSPLLLKMNLSRKIFLVVMTALSLTACSHFESAPTKEPSIGKNLLHCPRSPSGAVVKCAAEEFKITPIDVYVAYAKDTQRAEAQGFLHTKMTNYDGQVLRQPELPFQHNPNQIFSYYYETAMDGKYRSTGVMVQGTPTEIIFDAKGNPAYVGFGGQQARLLEYEMRQGQALVRVIEKDLGNGQVLKQDYKRHPHGFSSPVGAVKNLPDGKKYLTDFSIQELKIILEKWTEKGVTTIEYESGVVVKGELNFSKAFTGSASSSVDAPVVLTFNEGTTEVRFGNRVLFEKDWGIYDMILPERINISDTNLNANSPWIRSTLQLYDQP